MRLSGGLLALGLVISSLAAGALALQRLRVEQANRAVEVVLDYPDVAQWASALGKTVAAWLRGFSTPFSVALTEGTLADWGMPIGAPTPTYLLSEARFQQAKRVLALKARVELQPPQDAPAVEVRSESGARFWVVGDPLAITQLGLGLDPVQGRAGTGWRQADCGTANQPAGHHPARAAGQPALCAGAGRVAADFRGRPSAGLPSRSAGDGAQHPGERDALRRD
jgi:hypothetical protein